MYSAPQQTMDLRPAPGRRLQIVMRWEVGRVARPRLREAVWKENSCAAQATNPWPAICYRASPQTARCIAGSGQHRSRVHLGDLNRHSRCDRSERRRVRLRMPGCSSAGQVQAPSLGQARGLSAFHAARTGLVQPRSPRLLPGCRPSAERRPADCRRAATGIPPECT